jgi:hypothetical protein
MLFLKRRVVSHLSFFFFFKKKKRESSINMHENAGEKKENKQANRCIFNLSLGPFFYLTHNPLLLIPLWEKIFFCPINGLKN